MPHVPPAVAQAQRYAEAQRYTEARNAQRYRLRPDTCRNCAHLQYEVEHIRGTKPWDQYEVRPVRTNPRCGLGDFPVVTNAVCDRHKSQ
ncbi:hypothetical protein [Paraburkholderia sp. MM6662-R1]|uniref:hypothetical protein n=1 Tax=Paraburkholderia sp. MM6662-R1 TaxID=2991066 RepID=UPI003D218F09